MVERMQITVHGASPRPVAENARLHWSGTFLQVPALLLWLHLAEMFIIRQSLLSCSGPIRMLMRFIRHGRRLDVCVTLICPLKESPTLTKNSLRDPGYALYRYYRLGSFRTGTSQSKWGSQSKDGMGQTHPLNTNCLHPDAATEPGERCPS